MGTLEMLSWYFLAIAFGTLTKEMFHIGRNQSKYSKGDVGIKQQLANWWKVRWDDTAFSFFFGGGAAFIFHTMDIDALLADKIPGASGVSSEAMAFIVAAFSDKIMKLFVKRIKDEEDK